jgi:hypothetical protein
MNVFSCPEDSMAQTTYASRLRYLDADDLDDSVVDFGGLDVRGTDNAKLGDVDGFLVDPASGRVLYTVVASGGWFTSRRFLLPIGHAQADRDAGALRVDVARETVRNYPEFDEKRFRDLSDEELTAYESRMAAVCCPDDLRSGTSPAFDSGRHYAQPAWWTAGAYTEERLRPVEPRAFRDRSATTASAGDVSPHIGGRAQPGDVLGIETGGETTGIGDTAEDEDERRRYAERTVANEPVRNR